jgi:hypothetical protein
MSYITYITASQARVDDLLRDAAEWRQANDATWLSDLSPRRAPPSQRLKLLVSRLQRSARAMRSRPAVRA